uniref:Peptidase M41 domain-containing protein n=1 Tax=Chloropicon laureae TaxID=464258 RepID=A0A7S2Z2Z4_9CHLO|mmetsp:Transcript_2803/g.7065  ORF Transcript_2803/g.7065 Transcript_2803/m.7065 type:complete len:116 (+) Transcript_2803:3-350(+)
MSSAVGPIYISDIRSQSPQMQKEIDREVVTLLKDAEARVRTLLQRRVKELDQLAKALVERETLNQVQIKTLLGLKQEEAPGGIKEDLPAPPGDNGSSEDQLGAAEKPEEAKQASL